MKNIEDSITTAPRTGVLADFFEKTAHTFIVQEAETVDDTWKI